MDSGGGDKGEEGKKRRGEGEREKKKVVRGPTPAEGRWVFFFLFSFFEDAGPSWFRSMFLFLALQDPGLLKTLWFTVGASSIYRHLCPAAMWSINCDSTYE